MNKHAHPHNSASVHGSLRLMPTVDVDPPREVIEAYARQAENLAAMAANALRQAQARHEETVRSLRSLEAALLEQSAALAALTDTRGEDR